MIDKIFISVREYILPSSWLVKFFPKKGKVLDVGCGHGALVARLAKNTYLNVTGIDPSLEKIKKAKGMYSKLDNITFVNKKIEDAGKAKFNAISIIDVLYLLDDQQSQGILDKANKLLYKNGTLILCETEPNILISIQEYLATKIFKYTLNTSSELNFKNKSDYEHLLNKSNFTVAEEYYIKKLIYKHTLYIATKNSLK